jgi:cyclophilin family peptidyl-prolyl cis-trans isomerase
MTFRFMILTCAVWLSACGGGGADPVTGVTATNLKYGQTATLTLQGHALDNAIKVSSPACSQILLGNITSATSRTALCVVAKTGEHTITVSSSSDYVVYTSKLTVPEPQVTLTTSMGTIVMELNPTAAPITVNNLLSYVSKGFYTQTLFHRVIPGFMIQGGGFTTGMAQKTDTAAAIKLESQNGLLNTRGQVAMARSSAADSATSQFFINVVDNSFLNYTSSASPGYAVFGKVVSGMDVVDNMVKVSTTTLGSHQNVPITDVLIQSATQNQ